MYTKAILLFAAVVTMGGCANVGVTKINAASARPSDCSLDVFTSESEVSQSFEVVCLIDSQDKALIGESSIAEAISASKPAACECGADAVLYVSGDTQSANAVEFGSASAVVKAIRYTESEN